MKQNELLFILGSACVVVFAWIAFNILHDSLTSTISTSTIQTIQSIQPSFDNKVIDAMKKRTVVVPNFTIQPPSQNEIVVTTNPVPSAPIQQANLPPFATSSAKTASSGGNLQ